MILFVEDDNIAPYNGMRILHSHFTPWTRTALVGGVYETRTAPGCVCGARDSGNTGFWFDVPKISEVGDSIIPMKMVGGGFTMVHNAVIKKAFPFKCTEDVLPNGQKTLIGWDGNLGRTITSMGMQSYIDGRVQVEHKYHGKDDMMR